MKEKTSDRNNSLDLLRIISTFAVILIHCNARYFMDRSTDISFSANYVAESIMNIITRFSVPAFVMISGAFILGNDKNRDFKYFYSKSLYKIFLPMIPIVIMLFALLEFSQLRGEKDFITPVKALIIGNFFHLWFMYMLFGLYLCVPFIIRLKNSLPKNAKLLLTAAFMLWACFSQFFSTQKAAFTIGVVVSYLAYFLMGRCVYLYHKKVNKYVYLITALLMFALTFIVRMKGYTHYLFDTYTNFFSPTIVIAGICIFGFFCSINVKADLNKLSALTFYIYLFHKAVYLVLFKITDPFLSQYEVLHIIAVTCATFIIALVLALIYRTIWNYFSNKFFTFEKWCNKKIWKIFD